LLDDVTAKGVKCLHIFHWLNNEKCLLLAAIGNCYTGMQCSLLAVSLIFIALLHASPCVTATCPDGWYGCPSKCIFVYDRPLNFFAARSFCQVNEQAYHMPLKNVLMKPFRRSGAAS
jgi:hypothetical protein